MRVLYVHKIYSTTLGTTETQIILSDPINLNDNGLSVNKQSLYQHNSKDNVFEELLLNEAEQFFSKMIEDLTQVCISRLVDTYIPESVLSQLTTRSHRYSEDMPSVYTHGNENIFGLTIHCNQNKRP